MTFRAKKMIISLKKKKKLPLLEEGNDKQYNLPTWIKQEKYQPGLLFYLYSEANL